VAPLPSKSKEIFNIFAHLPMSHWSIDIDEQA
jgi:hypothetical protein